MKNNKIYFSLFFISLFLFSCDMNEGAMSFEEALQIKAEEYRRFADNNRDSIMADVADIEQYLETEGIVDYDTTYSGVRYYKTVEGNGPEIEPGLAVALYYRLHDLETGEMYDEARDPKTGDERPFVFTSYAANIIQGFDEGVEKFREGDEGYIFIPSDLGYGEEGNLKVPGNTNLYFFIKVRQVQN
ncbi:FKBP-type peptidyl-prolyl cis-trans isomerase [Mangrovivirga sp. M17]|uniref:Peptidyl-prolyl cis-trans isomerase n=1 Tax=Mangrovivirga halotolerans TaxID=2993936 RepID=A0ABT3RNI9_9BACT|nr:FKBP-type peptidyl-prolyl cis-trans isomerase [Mangrovivirga halotolerans]MCX2743157.1 FKBP-type peptidyl-prolyl cis-trans isomerase [Mangrovivirga halotolerans]